MHILTPLFALLALTPSITTAKPIAQTPHKDFFSEFGDPEAWFRRHSDPPPFTPSPISLPPDPHPVWVPEPEPIPPVDVVPFPRLDVPSPLSPWPAPTTRPKPESTTPASKPKTTTSSESDPCTTPEYGPSTSSKSQPTLTPKSGPSASSKSGPSTTSKSGPTTSFKSGPTISSKSEPATSSKSGLTTTPKPKTTTSSKSEPATTPKSKPTTTPKSGLTTTPKLKTTTTPNSKPTPPPKPESSTTPDLSRCHFIQIIRNSIDGPFNLTALSDTLPFQSWPVVLDIPSATSARFPYISRRDFSKANFTLKGGSLNYSSTSRGAFPARFISNFGPDPGSGGLESFFFGGQALAEEPVEFYSIQSCDVLGRPYTELKAGRDFIIREFAEGALIAGRNTQNDFHEPYTRIRFQINQIVETRKPLGGL